MEFMLRVCCPNPHIAISKDAHPVDVIGKQCKFTKLIFDS